MGGEVRNSSSTVVGAGSAEWRREWAVESREGESESGIVGAKTKEREGEGLEEGVRLF